MIFLGAGASKVFGLKTMQDLTNDLIKQLTEKGHQKVIDEILKALREYNLTPDFENIYTTLEALVNRARVVVLLVGFPVFFESMGCSMRAIMSRARGRNA